MNESNQVLGSSLVYSLSFEVAVLAVVTNVPFPAHQTKLTLHLFLAATSQQVANQPVLDCDCWLSGASVLIKTIEEI